MSKLHQIFRARHLYNRSSALVWWYYDISRSAGFVDDDIFPVIG